MDESIVPLLKEKKKNSGVSFLAFSLSFFVLTPSLFFLIPSTITYQTCNFIYNKIFTKKSKVKAKLIHSPEEFAKGVVKYASDKSGRIYDIVLVGATGYTGKLAAQYIAKTYGNKIRWAIAGRNEEELAKLRNELMRNNSNLTELKVIKVNLADNEEVTNLVKQTETVITTAGPFDKYGNLLVQYCSIYGTHYCDITGETDWVRSMIDQFSPAAKASGARIVHFCGHDCVPWDLSVLAMAEELKKYNKEGEEEDKLDTVTFFDDINSNASGGTLDTIFHSLSERAHYKSFLGFDPLLLDSNSSCSVNRLKFINYILGTYKKKEFPDKKSQGVWCSPFIMAAVMANAVKRSNAINNYSKHLKYIEIQEQPNFMSYYFTVVSLLFFSTSLFFPPLLCILKKFLPKPGQGPDLDYASKNGYLHVYGIGLSQKKRKIFTSLYFPTDPGYIDTARMLVESGLCVREKEGPGGVFTPASCQGLDLLKRLVDTGCSFSITSK